ncbi:Hypothetical predicted protein [Marmota monax]|uniref:Homeobox domain-containing protein n=1 Tax=Marmota monax TaxID=9995 RepID=A0A5E4C846_MARMO|nr:Hypothetical predicted protein [Marmota monax]
MDLLTALDELERDVTAEFELEGLLGGLDPREEMKKLRELLEPFASEWSILFFTKEQTMMLEDHFLKDPFPSRLTLLTLAFRLGLKERDLRHVQALMP